MMKTRSPLLAQRRQRAMDICLAVALGGSLAASARDDKSAQLMAGEGLGGIRIGMTEKKRVSLIGQPERKGLLTFQGGIEEFHQAWLYPTKGLEFTMTAGEHESGAKRVKDLAASARSALATARGIRVGSPESETRRTYAACAADPRESPAAAGSFVAGSIYNGIRFTFAHGTVDSIFLGAMAE